MFWGCEEIIEFYLAVVIVIVLSQAWANLSLFFLCQILRSFTKVSRFMFFPARFRLLFIFTN